MQAKWDYFAQYWDNSLAQSEGGGLKSDPQRYPDQNPHH